MKYDSNGWTTLSAKLKTCYTVYSFRNMYIKFYYVPCDLEDVCVDLSRKSNNLILSSKNMKVPDVKKP